MVFSSERTQSALFLATFDQQSGILPKDDRIESKGCETASLEIKLCLE